MTSVLDVLATRFCKALADDTGRRPRQWRPIDLIGVRCHIHAPKELLRIVAHAAKAGWLETKDGRGVALTAAGIKVRAMSPCD
jgi:hypothetical protein